MSAYRDDVAALAARHAALTAELDQKTHEVAASARLLEEARARARLPVLDNIRVASPCTADWSQMTGDARVRACGTCEKNVYNLSEMTREEAEALILEKEGKLCARYYQRKDGTILFQDCTIGAARQRRRRVIAAGVATLLAGGGAFLAVEQLSKAEAKAKAEATYMVMGEISPPEPLHPQPPPPGSSDSPAGER